MQYSSKRRGVGRAALRAVNRSLSGVDRLAIVRHDGRIAPLFIVGLPRSGTTLAYELIVQAFDVAFLTKISNYLYGLPNLTTRILSPFTRTPAPVYRSSYGSIPGRFAPAENSNLWLRWFAPSQLLGHYLPPTSVSRESAKEARRVIASMTAIAGHQFVFKNVYMTLSLAAVMQTFESARAVIVERDIDAVGESILRARKTQSSDGWWSIRPPLFQTVMNESPERQVAFQCARTTQLLERQLEKIDRSRFLKLGYNEMCESPRKALTRMHQWAGRTLEHRADFFVPESFERRQAERASGEFAAMVSEYDQDSDSYLSRVDELVAATIE